MPTSDRRRLQSVDHHSIASTPMRVCTRLALVTTLALASCGAPAPTSLMADPDVAATGSLPRPFDIGVRVQCQGPSARTAMLGALCGYGASEIQFDSTVSQFDLVIGPQGMPNILLYGFVPMPMSQANQNATVRYAAFLDLAPSSTPATDWPTAQRLTGTVTTIMAIRNVCTMGTFAAIADLRWQDVTIHIEWGASPRC